MSPILGIWASQGRVQGDFESIATVTVGAGGSSTVTFSSIPSTYKHLQIRGICRTTRSDLQDGIKVNFNSDTGNNYSWHYLRGDGSLTGAGAFTSVGNICASFDLVGANAGSNIFGGFIIDILDYSNTNKNKTTRTLAGADLNGSGSIGLCSGLWQSTSAINSITLAPYWGAFNWVQNSQFALYGCK